MEFPKKKIVWNCEWEKKHFSPIKRFKKTFGKRYNLEDLYIFGLLFITKISKCKKLLKIWKLNKLISLRETEEALKLFGGPKWYLVNFMDLCFIFKGHKILEFNYKPSLICGGIESLSHHFDQLYKHLPNLTTDSWMGHWFPWVSIFGCFWRHSY